MKWEEKYTERVRDSKQQMKEQIKANRILYHVGNARIYYIIFPLPKNEL